MPKRPRPRRFVVCADNHGDMQDDASVEAFFAFTNEFSPTVRVHLGDNWDFRNLRRGASDEEKAASLEDDWECGSNFVRRFFEKKSDNYFMTGNHDDRLNIMAESVTGVNRDYAESGLKRMSQLFKERSAKVFPYDAEKGVLELGGLSLLHGYTANANSVAEHARIYGNCLIGHLHTQDTAAAVRHGGAVCSSVGALCRMDMPYLVKKPGKIRHRNGWAYGLLFDDGSFIANLARRINGRFYASTNIEEIRIK